MMNLADAKVRRGWLHPLSRQGSSSSKDAVATQPSVFDDPDTADKYHPWPDWENHHRFDPLFRWTWGEEFRLVRKLDVYVMVWACIMFMALELDQAVPDGELVSRKERLVQ